MQVGILGPLEVATPQGQPVAVTGARLRTLLTRLALDAGSPVRAESLVDALWGGGEVPGDQANALQSLVSRLRRALPDSGLIVSAPGGYRLAVARDEVDAFRFERLAAEGRRALGAGDAEAAAGALRAALALWRGPALADAADAPFATAPAARLTELRLAAREDLYGAELAAGRGAAVLPELEALVTDHPLRERPRALLMRARYAAGRQAEALTAYEEYRTLLADELGVDPSPELRDLHLSVLRADPALTPPAAAYPPPAEEAPTGTGAAGPRTGNLRAALTSFIGREDELNLITKRLSEARLVTLVGPGGAGKTRLASTAATALADGFPGGAWIAELAPLTDPDDLPQAVLDALGRRVTAMLERPVPPGAASRPRDALGMLTDALALTPTLLVLDNCEHLIDAAARLADHLLGHCPALRVLATSREPLGITGETLSPVPPLGLPTDGADPRTAADAAAVRLLTDRAAAVRPGFTVDEHNAAAVVEICRRLDGLPLAIELAAARLRSLSPAQLAARLDDRFRVLTGGSRTAMPRHRTLHAVVAWSWELLTDEERRLADQLAVFSGGVTPASAEGVCGIPADEALELLTSLADKSILQVAGQADDPDGPRFRMLETLREYGFERLAAQGRVRAVRDAHAAYFLRLAETAEPELRGAGQLPWIAALIAERDNCMSVLHHAAATGDAETAIRLCAALALFWTMRGLHTEAVNWMRIALAVPGESPAEARTLVLGVALINEASTGDGQGLTPMVSRLRRELKALGDLSVRHPLLAFFVPGIEIFSRRMKPGGPFELPTLTVDHPDPWARSLVGLMRAAVRENTGDPLGTRDEILRAMDDFRSIGERWTLAMALTTLGETERILGEYGSAEARMTEALALMRELRTETDEHQVSVRLAALRALRGDPEGAIAELERLTEAAERRGGSFLVTTSRQMLGSVLRGRGRYAEALAHLDAALEVVERRAFAQPQLAAMVRREKAVALLASGAGPVSVERDLTHALREGIGVTDMPVVAFVGVGLAVLEEARGEPGRAATALGAAACARGIETPADPDVAALTARLRGALGDSGFDAAYGLGRDVSRAEAIDLLRRAAVGPDGEWEEDGEQTD
ncbi:BTAD domain-containing putative transcriptional regulator [Streptomyces sp. RFCAC02]|uniref:AfsR/SARP family transcriptional regulator n=1 Tax=Streptomyces sp. RFCAC02 TaxID=2499143 RepID=UPI00143D3E5D|nr:BTAD domain-containing putative transcriptional regulator [Streptomyces sp. RFCAC02]